MSNSNMDKEGVVEADCIDKVVEIDTQETKNTQESAETTQPRLWFKGQIVQLTLAVYSIIAVGGIFYFTGSSNPEIFKLNVQTLSVITEAYNAVVLLSIPFIFGGFGAVARLMLAGLNTFQNFKLVLASGLMATFSWLSIKSKVFIALLAPYIERGVQTNTNVINEHVKNSGSEFYSMALVAVLVGMFSSNIYIFIKQRVESITAKNQA